VATFTITVGTGQLVAPATPKLESAAERVRISDEQKIAELQDIVRKLVATNNAIVAQLHAAGVTGF
jgi:2,4-dienoyl-CoA reductase-like NADH-dependent reductase (Old Yellow Enzyme family)